MTTTRWCYKTMTNCGISSCAAGECILARDQGRGPHENPFAPTTRKIGWDIPAANPAGCICPPRSEQSCMNPNCGRKPPREQATS